MTAGHPRGRLVIATAALVLGGCVCEDGRWMDGTWMADTDVSYVSDHPDPPPSCEIVRVAHYSKSSAAIAERADPLLLEAARLEAERDCYKAAEAKLRQRLESLRRSG